MRIADLMTTETMSCSEFCTAQNAAKLLNQAECGILPVVNDVSRKVIGVITERSICLRVVASRGDPARIRAVECLDPAPTMCHPQDSGFAVLARLAQCHARAAIVLNARDELEGVVSVSVLATRMATAAQELYAALRRVNEQNAFVRAA